MVTSKESVASVLRLTN